MKYPDCPKCEVPFVRKVHRSFLFKLFKPMSKKRRYYCSNCGNTYYILRHE